MSLVWNPSTISNRWRHIVVVAALIVACSATKNGIETDNSAHRIVQEHAATHLETEFEMPADKEHLTEFLRRIRAAANRAELKTAWNGVPALAAKGDLLANIFRDAQEDGSWPATPPESAFVTGVRKAVEELLEGEG